MTVFHFIQLSTEQLDDVLGSLLVLRPPVDRVRLAQEFTTCDAVLVYDRPDSNPREVLANPGYFQHTWDDGRGDVPMLTHEGLAAMFDGMRHVSRKPMLPDKANPSLAGWLVVAKRQIDLLRQVQRSRLDGEPVNLTALANLLDDAGKGAPAIVPPTPEQLARPRWGGSR